MTGLRRCPRLRYTAEGSEALVRSYSVCRGSRKSID